MPSEWTTEAQKAFLQQELIAFKQIGGRAYMKNWPTLYSRFFQQWPERTSALPGVSADAPLTEDQKKVLADAVSQRQKQIRRWMHWHNGAGDNRAANNKTAKIIDGLLETKTHIKKPWEIYASIYYVSRVQQEVEAGTPIVDIAKKIREIFENESPEIREEIHQLSEAQKEDMKKRKKSRKTSEELTDHESDEADDNEGVETDPLIRCRNIQQFGAALQHILGHLGNQTGLKFTVLMGGLDPLDPDGGKFVASIHTGKTSDGHDFADAYSKFESEVVGAFGEFLDNVFASLQREEAPVGGDRDDEEDNSEQQVGHAEHEDKDEEMDEEFMDGDGVDDPPPNTYTPSPPSKSATLATSPASHLATPPGTRAATSTSGNLATDALSQQLAIPSHETLQVATSPVPHLAIPPAACPATSILGNFATSAVSQQLATPPATHPATPASASLATPPSARPAILPAALGLATSVASHQSPTIESQSGVTNAFGSSPTDSLGGGSFTSLLNSNDIFGWSDCGGSEWSDPFASESSSDSAVAGSRVGFGMNMYNYSLVPPGTTSLHDLELSASTISMTYPGFNDFNSNQYGMFGTSTFNQSHNALIPNAFSFSDSQVPLPVLPAPPTSSSMSLPLLPAPLAASSPPPVVLPNSQILPVLPAPAATSSSVSLPLLPAPLAVSFPPPAVLPNAQILPVLPAPAAASSPPSVSPNPLSDINTPPAPVIPPTQLGAINQPVHRSATMESTEATSLGRSKRKTVPSQHAQRDNAIGKENRVPPPATEAAKKPKSRALTKNDSGNNNPPRKKQKISKVR